MKSNFLNKNTMIDIISIIMLILGFLIFRYVLFDIHGMGEFPFLLFIFGVIIEAISFILRWHKIMLCTSFGYNSGFILGSVLIKNG